ncbi:MAG: WbqC family protein [Chloroflexi bacterium]|nr:WbqC family protein [Chloroflexota bacterium]
MLLALHQPNYLPYFGNFHKMAHVDVFVFFDNVPIGGGQSWVSRNRINLEGREVWLTVPIFKKGRFGQLINDVEIKWNTPWVRKHLGTIQLAYRRSPYLEEVLAVLQRAFDLRPSHLADLNITLSRTLADMLGIRCQFARASERVEVDSRGTLMIREVCQAFGCTTYFAGGANPNFHQEEVEKAGIRVQFQHFEHPVYDSLSGRFMPNLSILDAILSVGLEQVSKWLSMPQGSVPVAPVEKV